MKKKFTVLLIFLSILLSGVSAYDSPTKENIFFRMNDTDSTITDYSGNGNTGSVVNSPTFGATGVSKTLGEWDTGDAIGFGGDSSSNVNYIEITGQSLSTDNAYTLCSWVQTSDTSEDGDFDNTIAKYDDASSSGSTDGWGIFVNNEGSVHIATDGGNTLTTAESSGTVVDDDSYHHVCGTFDMVDNEARVYVDGSLDYTVTSFSDNSSGTMPLNIGVDQEGVSPGFDGELDEFRAIVGEVNSTEVSNLFQYNQYSSIDTSKPVVSIESPLNQTYTTNSTDLNVSADKSIDTWKYNLDGSGNVTFTPNTTLTALTDGSHTVDVYATDSGGDTGSSSVSFTVDTSAAISEYKNNQSLSAVSVSGTPTVSKAQPVYWSCGSSSDTDIEINCSHVESEKDVAFVDENGNDFLPYEHESFNSSEGGVSWVYDEWVRDGNRDAYIVSGNGSSDQQDALSTWSNDGAVTVQHLENNPLTATDSSPAGNDGTISGVTSITNGQFNGAGDWDLGDYIDLGSSTPLTGASQVTVLAYVNQDSQGDARVYNLHDTTGADVMLAEGIGSLNTGHVTFRLADDSDNRYVINSDSSVLNTDEWHQLAGIWRGSNYGDIFVDGSTVSVSNPDAGSPSTILDPNEQESIGNQLASDGTSADEYDGQIDALRLYNESKNSEWLKADYDASNKGGLSFFQATDPDNTAPNLTIDSAPAENTDVQTPFRVNVTATDSDSGVEKVVYSADGFQTEKNYRTKEEDLIIQDLAGDVAVNDTIEIKAVDGAGNSVIKSLNYSKINYIAWGEAHFHTETNEFDPSITNEELFNAIYDTGKVDWIAPTEHGDQMDSTYWSNYKDTINNFNDPGNFTTFLGYEHTEGGGLDETDTENTGQANIIWRDFNSSTDYVDTGEKSTLYGAMGQLEQESDYPYFVSSQHQVNYDPDVGKDGWNYTDVVQNLSEFDEFRQIEVYQRRGSAMAEWQGFNDNNGLIETYKNYSAGSQGFMYNETGYAESFEGWSIYGLQQDWTGGPVGIMGVSDSHMAETNAIPASCEIDDNHDIMLYGGGLTGVYTDSVDRNSIWNAMNATKTYSTQCKRSSAKVVVDGSVNPKVISPSNDEVNVVASPLDGDEITSITLWDNMNRTHEQAGVVAHKEYSGKKYVNASFANTGEDGDIYIARITYNGTSSDTDNPYNQWNAWTKPVYVESADTDTTPPTSSDNWTESGSVDKSEVDVELTASDDDSGVSNITYCVNGSCSTDTGSTTVVTISNQDNNTLDYYATDNAGNVEATNTEYVALDFDNDSPPSVSLSLNSSEIYVNESVEASVSATDDKQVDSVSLDWTGDGIYEETQSSSSLTAVRQFNSSGIYSVTARATDNNSQTDTTSVSLDVQKNVTDVNKTIVESCSNSNSSDVFCHDNRTREEKIDGGFTSEDSVRLNSTVNANGIEGNYTVFGFANSTGEHNRLVESGKVTVEVGSASGDTNSAPTPDFSITPSDPVAGESITFDASSSSDSDGSISSYQWDWTGDGTFDSSGETQSHTYSSSGDYSVKLKVVDNDGASTTLDQTITIGTSSDGGGDSGGDDSTDDGSGGGTVGGGSDDDSTDATASLDNSSVQILSPYSQSRFQTESLVTINEGESTTISVCNAEYTVEVSSVQSQKEADLLIQGEQGTYSEGQVLPSSCDVNFQDGAIYLSSVVDHGSGNGAVSLSIRSVNPIDFSKAFYAYNYTIDQEGTVELLQKKTTEENYTVIDSFSTTSTVTDQLRTYNQSLDSAVYQVKARLTVNGSTSETRPVGFYTGTVPVIDILRPEDGKTIAKPLGQANTSLTLDYRFDNENNVSVKTGTQYVGPSGREFKGDLSDPEFVGEDNTLFVRSFRTVANFIFSWTDGITFGPDVTVLQNSSVPVQGIGQFTGSVKLVDNQSGSYFNTTSVPITVNIQGYNLNNESEREEYLGLRDSDLEYSYSETNSTNVTISENSSTRYYSSKLAMFEPDPNETITADLNDLTVDLKFDYVVNSTGIVNRSLYLEGPEQDIKIDLNPYKAQYEVPVNESVFGGSWSEGNYTVRGEVYYQNGTKIPNQTIRPDYKFVVKEKITDYRKCTDKGFYQALGCYLNPLNYGVGVQLTAGALYLVAFVGITLFVKRFVLGKLFDREIGIVAAITGVFGNVWIGVWPQIIGLILFLICLLSIAGGLKRRLG